MIAAVTMNRSTFSSSNVAARRTLELPEEQLTGAAQMSGILAAGQSDAAVGHTFNLGNGREITINNLAQTVAAVAGRSDCQVLHDNPRPGDVLRLYADITKARSLLGFQPTVSLREGLGRLKAWYESLGRSPQDLLAQEIVHNWEAPQSKRVA